MRPKEILSMNAREQAFLIACLIKEDEEQKRIIEEEKRKSQYGILQH